MYGGHAPPSVALNLSARCVDALHTVHVHGIGPTCASEVAACMHGWIQEDQLPQDSALHAALLCMPRQCFAQYTYFKAPHNHTSAAASDSSGPPAQPRSGVVQTLPDAHACMHVAIQSSARRLNCARGQWQERGHATGIAHACMHMLAGQMSERSGARAFADGAYGLCACDVPSTCCLPRAGAGTRSGAQRRTAPSRTRLLARSGPLRPIHPSTDPRAC